MLELKYILPIALLVLILFLVWVDYNEYNKDKKHLQNPKH